MKAIVFAAALAASIIPAAAGSTTAGIPGVFDPQTRIFVPQPAESGATSRGAATRSGVVQVAMSINIASPVLAGEPLQCMAAISHVGFANTLYTESAQAVATRNGATATCTVRIPYLWQFAESSGVVQTQIMVTASNRQLVHQLPTFAVPATGATKAITQNLRF
jgi:hypothetical protein